MKKNSELKRLPRISIRNCKECDGKPEKEPFELSDFKGLKCKNCYQIISYERVTKIKETSINIQKFKIQGI